MDYFNGVTNEDFKSYFLECLNCRTELTQYIYPHEILEDNDVRDEHIMRCQNIINDYIFQTIVSFNNEQELKISREVIDSKYNEKSKEIYSLCLPEIESYFENVKVVYLDLS
jgi:hypothetical protein